MSTIYGNQHICRGSATGPDSPHKPPVLRPIPLAWACEIASALRSSSQPPGFSPAPVAENTVGDFATDPQPKPARAHECGASIRRKDRDRADCLAEEGPIRLPGARGAHPIRTRANFDSRLRDEQSEHAGGEFLLSQDPALTAEAWDHRVFGCNRRRRHWRRARRDLRTCQVLARRIHITLAIVAARPASHAAPEIPGRCEGRGRAARASRPVRSPARGAACRRKDQVAAADNRVAAGRDLQGTMNCRR